VYIGERFQTTFLSPDGFVQPPWKPHIPQNPLTLGQQKEEPRWLTLSFSPFGRVYKAVRRWLLISPATFVSLVFTLSTLVWFRVCVVQEEEEEDEDEEE